MTAPKKTKKLPPRGASGRFVKSGIPRPVEPELVEAPTYSVHRVGMDPIDWQRELTREVLPPRRRLKPPKNDSGGGVLGWGALIVGGLGVGYALNKALRKPRHL